jgi:hypothetical protein
LSQVVLVYFVGGCTYAEVSAVRFLQQQIEGIEPLVATTKVISGDALLHDVLWCALSLVACALTAVSREVVDSLKPRAAAASGPGPAPLPRK